MEEVRTVQIAEEVAQVATRIVETGRTRIHVTVTERDEVVDALLMRQDVTVERVAIGTPVDSPPPIRREGDVVIVPVLEEVLVTETRLILREELRIRIGETRHPTSQVVRLRRESADIEQGGTQ